MPAPLKICLFNSCPMWGGGEKWHYEVATSLDKERFKVFAGVQHDSPLQKRLVDAGIATKAFSIGNLSLLNPFLILAMVRWFKQQQPDVVILNLPSDLKTAGVAAKIAGVRRIIYRRGSAIPVRNTFLNRWLFSSILTEMIANSEETKKTVLSRNPKLMDSGKIKVIYNGIDLETYTDITVAESPKEQGQPIVLGTAGRLSYQKNQAFLLDVAVELKRRGVNFKILLAGDGPLKEELLNKADSDGLTDDVEFMGFVDDVPGFMQKIDVFLLCSHWEGFGYVLTEAMASGKPVVAFNNSSTPEVVINDQTGLLTKPEDVEQFVSAVMALARDSERCRRFGKNGRQRVEKLFNKNRLLNELEEFLLE